LCIVSVDLGAHQDELIIEPHIGLTHMLRSCRHVSGGRRHVTGQISSSLNMCRQGRPARRTVVMTGGRPVLSVTCPVARQFFYSTPDPCWPGDAYREPVVCWITRLEKRTTPESIRSHSFAPVRRHSTSPPSTQSSCSPRFYNPNKLVHPLPSFPPPSHAFLKPRHRHDLAASLV
jgi:hypothetical protein